MSHPTFAVVGNCQARPLENLIELLAPEWRSLGSIIVHLTSPDEEDADIAQIEDADIIFAQLVHDGYRAPHVATNSLVERFADRVIAWPNLFFHGQCLDTYALTASTGRFIPSPLESYHSLTVLKCWKAGESVDFCIAKMVDDEVDDEDDIVAGIERTLSQLEHREQRAAVRISDFIEDRWRDQPLFHVFNHPASVVMIEVAQRLLRVAGIRHNAVPTPQLVAEPLGRYVPPTLPAHARILGLRYAHSVMAKGVGLSFTEDGTAQWGRAKVFSLEEFVAASYRSYDVNRDSIETARITPAH